MKNSIHLAIIGLVSSFAQAGYLEDRLNQLRAQGAQVKQVYKTSSAQEQSLNYKPIEDVQIPESVHKNYVTPVTSPAKLPTDANGNYQMTARYHVVLNPDDDSQDEALIAKAHETTKSRMEKFVGTLGELRDKGLKMLTEADRAGAFAWLKQHIDEKWCANRDHHRVYRVETMLGIGQQDKDCDPLGFYGPSTHPQWNSNGNTSKISRVPTIPRHLLTDQKSDKFDKELCETYQEMWADIYFYDNPRKMEEHLLNQWKEFNCKRFFGDLLK